MNQDLFKDVDRLGFGRALQQQAERRLGLTGPHFTASERRRIASHEVKLLAHLTYDKKNQQLAVRSYDIIDLTVRRPDMRRPLVTQLEQQMKAINWNAVQFSWEHLASFGADAKLLAQTSKVEEALKNMKVLDVEGEIESERLRLKYMYDTLYGQMTHLDGLNGYKYHDHFNMLSIDRGTRLIKVSDAVDLLFQKDLNNYRPKEIIDAFVAARLQKTMPIRQATVRHQPVIQETTAIRPGK